MRFERIKAIPPLNRLMLKLLKDFYRREKQEADPTLMYDPELIKGLTDRALIEMVEKENHLEAYRITELGNEYMKHYFSE